MTVLFACTQNAGRSQMAAALVERAAQGRARVLSAGTQPAFAVHPAVVQALAEVGIDISDRTPQRLTPELAQAADLLVTMGCGDACPYVPGLRMMDWPLSDPKDQPLEAVRLIRDEIARRVDALIRQLGI